MWKALYLLRHIIKVDVEGDSVTFAFLSELAGHGTGLPLGRLANERLIAPLVSLASLSDVRDFLAIASCSKALLC